MSLSRRAFFRTAGAAGVGFAATDLITARGREAFAATLTQAPALKTTSTTSKLIKIMANENAYGPGPAALDAIRALVGPASGRYPMNQPELESAIAKHFGALGVAPKNVLVGTGSTEVIKAAVHAFTGPTRALVAAMPTWEDPGRTARSLKAPVKDIAVDSDLRIDIAATAAAAKGAGLVFFCNPNNPTGTVHGNAAVTKFVEDVLAASPQTTILLDEAYYDFVVDPTYATGIPLAMKYPRVIVTRTFSKVHGMAGLRVGYAIGHPDTLKKIASRQTSDMNVISMAAASASIQDSAHIAKQRDTIRKSLEETMQVFKDAGCRVADSQANFLLADVKRPTKEFRDACEKQGVIIGRDFPPLATWARVSIGTTEEMRIANEVFRKILAGGKTTTASR
ncbi:MAG TPA: aminotransferase class I/II-fold pyridoxal phosphate-dependent enzyme [Vicinamibacterales bacterium]|nr:aminotransferase class I/II-fold pyridoxal phosphate-dependent enzyme [Vicinamibacterales bacterium]